MKQTLTLACLLVLILALCSRLAVREARETRPATATVPGDTGGDPRYTPHPVNMRPDANGLLPVDAHTVCPDCNSTGRLVGRFTGYVQSCPRCGGSGWIWPGLEQRQSEPLDRVRESPDAHSQFRLPKPGIYGGTP